MKQLSRGKKILLFLIVGAFLIVICTIGAVKLHTYILKTKEYPAAMSNLPQLYVNGSQLEDQNGNIVQLKGMSTYGIMTKYEYVNKECFRYLQEEAGMNVVRLAMYTSYQSGAGGYCNDSGVKWIDDYLREILKLRIDKGIQYASENEMYAIIDWHILSDGNPMIHVEEAKEFFSEMANRYADHTNVIYEICNEPNGYISWSDVKEYSNIIIPAIRNADPDSIIIVGTPTWSQDINYAETDPLTGYQNIMYAVHFYAATQRIDLRRKVKSALEKGVPIFVSEFGTCQSNGDGKNDLDSANEWMNLLNEYHVSYVGWNLSNKDESSSFLKSTCKKTSGFLPEDLSVFGKWYVEHLKEFPPQLH